MKFPLKADDSLQVPPHGECLICSKRIGEVHGFIRLTVGAILHFDKKRTVGGTSDKMDSVFSLWYHGPHPSAKGSDGEVVITSYDNAEYRLPIVEPTKGGQVDVHFCSPECLESFSNSIIAKLKDGIEAAKKDFEKRRVEPVAGGDATR